MARHIWSVLCYKSLNDRVSNQISLIDVLENLTIHLEPPATGEVINIPQRMELITFLSRSDLGVAEKGLLRVVFESPEGRRSEPQILPFSLETDGKARVIIAMDQIPVSAPGVYCFCVEFRSDDELEGEWVEWTKIPLEIIYDKSE